MCELFLDLLVTRLKYDPVPCNLLSTLALILDTENYWNSKNRDQVAKGRWESVQSSRLDGHGSNNVDFARSPESSNSFTKDSYGWLVDLINMFGDKKGFQIIEEKFDKSEKLTAKEMSSLLQPFGNCAMLLVPDTFKHSFSSTIELRIKP